MPFIKVDGKESNLVCLQKLDVNISITGTVATTTWTMTFLNKTNRILEGELNFPLADGISVSRYALDINGHLREAVPVEKARGALVFESIERRRVDPGLLEKVDGNQFRSRIYPINPHSSRIVLIGYQEELALDRHSALRYRLPMAFKQPMEDFSIRVDVVRSSNPPVFEQNPDDELRFDAWDENYSASRQWKDYLANKPLTIRIPKSPDASEVMMQQAGNHYFYVVNTFPQQKKIEKKLPSSITLVWDASLSGLSRNTGKEMDLLDAYFARLQQAKVTLVNFSNSVQAPSYFTVTNGQWDQLRNALRNTTYDGATQFGVLDLKKYPAEEVLLFSDGHSSYGSSDIHFGDQPVYAIASSPRTDFPFLRYIAERSGGELINLSEKEPEEARDQLLYQHLHFLGVRRSPDLEESYPFLPIPVTGSMSVAGISYKPVQDIVLQFGYGSKVVMEKTVRLDFSKQQARQVDLSRIWAQKKIAELDRQYDNNKGIITELGKRYGIITRNTSLIVLENVEDYVTYGIEPPAELREAYDRIMKQRGENNRSISRISTDNAENYFNELLAWWQTDYTRKLPPAPLRKNTGDDHVQNEELVGRAAGISVNTRNRPAPSSANGSGSSRMDEVVVVGYSSRRKREVTNSVTTEISTEMEDRTGDDPSPASNGYFTPRPVEDTKADYLAKIKAASPGRQYAAYLQIRKNYIDAPLFYFNTASFFLNMGNKEIGLKILSNIAELDLENYELSKLLGYKLKELGEYTAACAVFRRVLDWRPFEPQSYRDYGLALEDAGFYQQALDTLYAALVRNYDANVSSLYPGIEETILPEINQLIAAKADKINFSNIPKKLIRNMPVDIRVVLNWNMNDTDIDLWVTDPNNEKCYYSHRNTEMGGRISHDFTRGLGPEQFMLKRAAKGKYKVEVNYYGDTQVKLAGPTTVMVEVYTNYGTPRQSRRIITMQMLPENKGTVLVGEFEF